MAVSKEIEQDIVERLEKAGKVRSRRMFGGVGLYVDDAFCAIIGSDAGQLFLKADDSTRADYEREGMRIFGTPKGTMSYYAVPDRVFEDPKLLRKWVRAAVAVAKRAKATPPRKRRR
jgi:DNA transformation protein